MSSVAKTSTCPYGNVIEQENWTLWKQQPSVLEIDSQQSTDIRSVSDIKQASVTDSGAVSAVQIHRPQYNAILKRFEQAKKTVPGFTKWNI